MKVKKALTERGGFTLVEMAIAIVILAVIIGVVILAESGTVNSARVAAATEQLTQVRAALTEYYNVEPGYPQSLATPIMKNYLPAAPDASRYQYACTTGGSGGVSFTYEARDGAEAAAVVTAWQSIVGTANATVTMGTEAKATLAVPPVVCMSQ